MQRCGIFFRLVRLLFHAVLFVIFFPQSLIGYLWIMCAALLHIVGVGRCASALIEFPGKIGIVFSIGTVSQVKIPLQSGAGDPVQIFLQTAPSVPCRFVCIFAIGSAHGVLLLPAVYNGKKTTLSQGDSKHFHTGTAYGVV